MVADALGGDGAISVIVVTEEEVVELYRSGLPVIEVASSAGISTAELYRVLRRHGFESFRRKGPAVVTDFDREVVAGYLAADRTTVELAADLGVPPARIYYSLRRAGQQPNRQKRDRGHDPDSAETDSGRPTPG